MWRFALAIIAIAGLLASKEQSFDEWNKVQNSFGYALERHSGINEMIQILSLSYFDLPPHLQSCLLYLSIFPEDYVIEKERLVLRWIAEGFIHEEHGCTLYEIGERCFDELINKSLIQPWGTDVLSSVLSCRVHDTILEFIVSKAMEENFSTLFGVPDVTFDPRRKIRRLSLQDRNKDGDTLLSLPENQIYSHARAISVFATNLVHLPSLLKFRHVRVLDLEGCRGLQAHHLAHLGRLFALRYLSLQDTRIHDLPEEIGALQYLETLDIRLNKITDLPSTVALLQRLVNLLCDHDVKLLDGFGSMQALQNLQSIGLLCQSPSFAQELRQLTNLRMLTVHFDEAIGASTKDVASSLNKLGTGSLNSLTIGICKENEDFLMEAWSTAPRSLKQLEILWIVPSVPRWIGSLVNLQELRLGVDRLGPIDVHLLGCMPVLSHLCLWATREVADRSSSQETQQVKISGASGFPCLRMFWVGSEYCRLGWLFKPGAMPKLQELTLVFCEAKTKSLFLTDGELDFGIQHFSSLTRVRLCPSHLITRV